MTFRPDMASNRRGLYFSTLDTCAVVKSTLAMLRPSSCCARLVRPGWVTGRYPTARRRSVLRIDAIGTPGGPIGRRKGVYFARIQRLNSWADERDEWLRFR